ncbi:MAG: glycosyltransferase family 4 protein [Anaerolineales bacterium]|nr:glycosyltransferase family 4 protein [Anaerolineales bacterium]
MKIGLVVPGFSAHEQDWCIPALLDYVRALARLAEVHVFTLRWPERGGAYPVYGATVRALDGRKRLGPRVVALWARAVRAIAVEHRRGSFDALHAFWLDEPGWVAAWAARRLGVRAVLSLAGGELSRMPDIGYGLQLWPGRGALVRWCARQAAVVTAGSRAYAAVAESHFAAHGLKFPVVVAPLGVDLDRFQPRPAGPGAAQRLINVGALAPVKDQALLLRAFRRVAAVRPTAELVIVGEGALRSDLEAQAAGLPVRFAGAVPHADLPAWYANAAVCVQTSRHEAQGLAVLEAAACGLPVVGTPVGVLPEVGRAAAAEAELARVLLELLADDTQRRALAAAGQAVVRARFGLAGAVERFLALYANSASPAPAGAPGAPAHTPG